MNKKYAIHCESCTEPTKQIVFCDGKDNNCTDVFKKGSYKTWNYVQQG